MMKQTGQTSSSQRWVRRGIVIALLSVALALGTVGAVNAAPFDAFATHPHASPPTTVAPLGGMQEWAQNGAWFQRMIYLYASGMPPIQQAALSAGAQAKLTTSQVASVTQAVRTTWVSLMRIDPATLGRMGAHPNIAGQWRALMGLRSTLAHIAGSHITAFYAASGRVYAQVSQYSWLIAHLPHAHSITKTFGDYALIYATAFSIPNTPTSEQYVALPDVYLKYANLGEGSLIPTPYQSAYQVGANYTVDVVSAYGLGEARRIPILDDGPWNEDDNWWDQMNPSATLASDCPVASSTLSGATTNAQVDGICPGARDWRRVAYYLLYQHGGLPFFQTTSYKPSGSFSNGTNWPTTLAQNCPESVLASINNDAAPCGNTGYNNHNGAWLRDGTVQSPILNQAGIDLSPATDASLGWVW